jgi:hypothetical protein
VRLQLVERRLQLADLVAGVLADHDGRGRGRAPDDLERRHDGDGMVREHRAPALGHEDRRIDALLVADRLHAVDDVAAIPLERVVEAPVGAAARSVVVDGEAAAEVERRERRRALLQVAVEARRLLHGFLRRADVAHLRSDVEVDAGDRVHQVLLLQEHERLEQLGRRQPELRVRPAGVLPLADAFGVQARAEPDERLDADLARDRHHLADLVDRLRDQQDPRPRPERAQRELDVVAVLEAVADDVRLGVQRHRERERELALAADLEAVAVLAAFLDERLDDDALLVHLDREDSLVVLRVVELLDRGRERVVEAADPVLQDLREPDQERRAEPAAAELLDDVLEPEICRVVLGRTHADAARVVDREVPLAPLVDGGLGDRVLLADRLGIGGPDGRPLRSREVHRGKSHSSFELSTLTLSVPVNRSRILSIERMCSTLSRTIERSGAWMMICPAR